MKYQHLWRRLRTQTGTPAWSLIRLQGRKILNTVHCQGCRIDFERNIHLACPPVHSFCFRACYPLWSLLPPLKLTATSRAYCRVESLLSRPKLVVASRAYCRLMSLLLPPELVSAARA